MDRHDCHYHHQSPLPMYGRFFAFFVAAALLIGLSAPVARGRGGFSTVEVTLNACPERPLFYTYNMPVYAFNSPLVDIYILWETNLYAKSYSEKYYNKTLGDPSYLGNVVDAFLAVNPNIQFAIGTFTNKRLPGVGWPDDYAFTHQKSFTTNGDSIASKLDPQSINYGTHNETSTQVSSAAEAMLIVMRDWHMNGGRDGQRRIIWVVGNSLMGFEHDVYPRLRSPDTRKCPQLNVTYDDEELPRAENISFFPQNDLTDDLLKSCQIHSNCMCDDPAHIVLNNDGIVGASRQASVFPPEYEELFSRFQPGLRYERIVEVFGGHPEFVTEPAEIRPALERSAASAVPACINVRVDPDARHPGFW